MIIDIIIAIALIIAVIKGYQQGLIVAVFSVLAFIVGLAAAIKLSAVAAGYIGKTVKISDQWLPVISFAVVFFIVVLLIRWGAKLIQKTIQFAMLGWVNRLGGILLFVVLIYTHFQCTYFLCRAGFANKTRNKECIRYISIHTTLGPKSD